MQKRYIVSAILLLCVMLTSCGKQYVDQVDSYVESVDIVTEPKIDYTMKYKEVLASVYSLIKSDLSQVEADEGVAGIIEVAMYLGEEALSEVGYVIKDINDDNIPELLIGSFVKEDDAYTNNDIYALYTLSNDKPVLVLEGWARSMYSLNEDDSLFYSGSGGAAYSVFGLYHISKDAQVVCDDYYFTYPDDNDYSKIELYRNNTGIFEREVSEKLEMSHDDFYKIHENMARKTATLEATPFANVSDDILY